MTSALWVIISATIFSGFFSLVGFSLRQFSTVHLEEALGGEKGKGKLRLFEKHLEGLRLTIAVCRVFCNLMVISGVFLWSGGSGLTLSGSVWAVLVSVGIIAIFGVSIPHAWASYSGEKVLAAVFYPIILLRFIFYPATIFMRLVDVPIKRLSGAAQYNEEDEISEARQEILQAAEEGQAEGAVDADEVEMIESVIEFSQTHCDEIMTPRTDIFALSADTPWEKMARTIHQSGRTRVPVYEGDIDNITGILYAKDLLKYFDEKPPSDINAFVRKPYFVPESKRLDDLLREFKAKKNHLAIVLDEYGGTAGIVSIEDIIEEIVGEIDDEYDQTSPEMMKPIDENSALIDGRMIIDDLNDAMKLKLPEDEDYETIAGLVFDELGYIPKPKEIIQAHGVKITILSANERKITQLKIERMNEEDED